MESLEILAALPDIEFEVAFAGAAGSSVRRLRAPAGISVGDALSMARETCHDFPSVAWTHEQVAIYGKRVEDTSMPLSGGERLEILRPLVIDPAQARRSRA